MGDDPELENLTEENYMQEGLLALHGDTSDDLLLLVALGEDLIRCHHCDEEVVNVHSILRAVGRICTSLEESLSRGDSSAGQEVLTQCSEIVTGFQDLDPRIAKLVSILP